MRRTLIALACTLPALSALGACASHKEAGPEDPRLVTTSEANRSGLSSAMQAPLRDVNVVRTKIPQVLLDAMVDPYARPPSVDCLTLAELIRPLNDTLGDDLDLVPPSEDEDLIDRGKGWAGDTALGAVAGAASDLLPMRGWVRKLSGAEKHDQLVQAAAAGGAVRRAYLKGLGEARGCEPPATPDHTRTNLPREEPKKGPRFPIRLPDSDTPAPMAQPQPLPLPPPRPN
jgi:hypothetical protein